MYPSKRKFYCVSLDSLSNVADSWTQAETVAIQIPPTPVPRTSLHTNATPPASIRAFARRGSRSAVVAPARQGDSSVSPAMTVKAFHQVRGTFAGPQVDLRRSAVCVFDDAQAIRGDGSQDPPEGQRSSDLLARVAARQTDKFARQGRGTACCVCAANYRDQKRIHSNFSVAKSAACSSTVAIACEMHISRY